MGEGYYGAVYLACRSGKCNYVIKQQLNNNEFKYEVKALYELNDWEYSPTIYDAWTCGVWGYLVIDKLERNCYHRWDWINNIIRYYRLYRGYEWQNVKRILQSLKKRNWYHVDTHDGNIMCDKKGNKKLIDYGWARKFENDKEIYTDHPVKKRHFLKGVDRDLLESIQGAMHEGHFRRDNKQLQEANEKVDMNIDRLITEGWECDC